MFRANRADLYMRHDDDSNSAFGQDTSISGQFAQEWELRAMAEAAAFEEVVSTKLRRLSARSQSFG